MVGVGSHVIALYGFSISGEDVFIHIFQSENEL